jgi:hypothetical protein
VSKPKAAWLDSAGCAGGASRGQSVDSIASFLAVEGSSTRDIKLTTNDLSRVRQVVKLGDGAQPTAVRSMNNSE